MPGTALSTSSKIPDRYLTKMIGAEEVEVVVDFYGPGGSLSDAGVERVATNRHDGVDERRRGR